MAILLSPSELRSFPALGGGGGGHLLCPIL